jgi:hypothetical protein
MELRRTKRQVNKRRTKREETRRDGRIIIDGDYKEDRDGSREGIERGQGQ